MNYEGKKPTQFGGWATARSQAVATGMQDKMARARAGSNRPKYGPPTAQQEGDARGTKHLGRGPMITDEQQARFDRYNAMKSGFEMQAYKAGKVAPRPVDNNPTIDTGLHNTEGLKWFGED